ncbi:energy transducer TonB [Halomonas organivorans]|uniref:Protein TonB n=1 Tax=Halomonas organivorans TaxID=257772 RepID=A0A7W5BYG3_9GAMM|nr:TonB family protein [Halomonas organivorans]MBB3141476.1 protein TonB [Halomonas organivorans]
MAAPVNDPIRYVPVTRPYRYWLAWAASLLLHLVVIGAVASRQFAPAPLERTGLDVVLVSRPAESPVAAEALAEAAQLAAGTAAETPPAESRTAPRARSSATPATVPAGAPATPTEPDVAARPEPEVQPEPSAPPAVEPEPPQEQQAAESPEPRPSVAQTEKDDAPTATDTPVSGRDLLAQATASIREQGLSADYAGEAMGQARPAAQQAAEARYIDDWTRRVEDYGNRVHPAPPELEGQLRIRVVIGRDGQVRRAEVIQSSGHSELDQAALDTVHGAAPYRPFDAGMGDLDSLSITRIWRFGEGNDYGVR